MIPEIELWAQQGIDKLCEPYRTNLADVKIDMAEAGALIRAAYAAGYSDALTDEFPVEDAGARAQVLALMLPV